MKAPEPTDKKYTYWHKGAFKKMFNNRLFIEDCRKYDAYKKEQNDKTDKQSN